MTIQHLKNQFAVLLCVGSFTLAVQAATPTSSASNPQPESYLPWAEVTKLDDHWYYLAEDSKKLPADILDKKYSPVTLPHTWNAKDSLETKNYRRAGSWYRRKIQVTQDDLQQRLYLRFGAAGQQADVYVNGQKKTHHMGGYSAFIVELTGSVKKGDNQIDVRVSNAHDSNLIPHSGDFTFYGGLYRSVHLLRGPQMGICRTHHASSGVKLKSSEVSKEKATLAASVMLDTRIKGQAKRAQVVLTLRDPQGKVCATTTRTANVGGDKPMSLKLNPITITNPALWSPESPNLYTVTLQVKDGSGKLIDTSTVRHGFRWYQFTPDKGFFLNGKSYRLNGVNRHQDFYKKGNALSLADHERDIRLIKEVGSNWLRLAHYQQHDHILDLCDELGLLVWEEIPWVDGTSFTPEFQSNMRSMMKDLIHQHCNHPSIVVWGISNEVRLKKGDKNKAKQCPLVQNLHDLIHELDPSRVSGIVSGDTNSYSDLGVMDIPDVIGYNLYRGWYGGQPENFITRATQLHKKNPDKPMVITEYGAGSDARIHTLTPRKQDFSEEWQVFFFEEHDKQYKKMPWLSGMNWWAYADFGSANRGDSLPHVNQKGLVDFKRNKKDVFFAAQALWSNTPVLHIQSSAWIKRDGSPEQPVRVISNMDQVELFYQGKSLGKQSDGFTWKVTFVEGENKLLAKGSRGNITKEHPITVTWRKSMKRFKVTSSNEEKGNVIANISDGKLYTRWACKGNATVNIDLGRPMLLDGLNFAFYHGATRQYKMEILTSSDTKTYTSVFSGASKGGSENEDIRFKQQSEARYIRILAKGNSDNDFNSWLEVEPIIATEKNKKNRYEIIGEGDK